MGTASAKLADTHVRGPKQTAGFDQVWLKPERLLQIRHPPSRSLVSERRTVPRGKAHACGMGPAPRLPLAPFAHPPPSVCRGTLHPGSRGVRLHWGGTELRT